MSVKFINNIVALIEVTLTPGQPVAKVSGMSDVC